jgi:hypothetical protein
MPGPARIVAFGMGLFGAVVASQAPEFAQQYRQRLGGAVDELVRIVDRFDADAQSAGRTRDDALNRLTRDADRFLQNQGASMSDTMRRLDRLRAQQQAMAQAGPFARVAALTTQADPSIARAAYRDFEPAVPVTLEGGVATVTGFAAAWALALGLFKGLGRLVRRRKRVSARVYSA